MLTKILMFASVFLCAFYIWGQTQNPYVRFIILALFAVVVYKVSTVGTEF
jgi:hypothetical protein